MCKQDLINNMRRRSSGGDNEFRVRLGGIMPETAEVLDGDVPPEVEDGESTGCCHLCSMCLEWFTGTKYFYLIDMYSSLILPWVSIAHWPFDVIIALRLWNGEMLYRDDDGVRGSYPVNTRNYAIAYMTVLILSLRHQTLFFIIRNNSFPFFDQYSAWSKIRTAVFYIPVIGSINQSRMTIENYEENVLKPDGQTLKLMNKWVAIIEGAIFIEIAAWVTIPFMMVRKVLWTLRVWNNDVSDEMENSEDFIINGNKAKRKKKEEEEKEEEEQFQDTESQEEGKKEEEEEEDYLIWRQREHLRVHVSNNAVLKAKNKEKEKIEEPKKDSMDTDEESKTKKVKSSMSEKLMGIFSLSESDFNVKATPIYSKGLTYQKFLKYVSMWTSCLEDIPQLIIIIILEIHLRLKKRSQMKMAMELDSELYHFISVSIINSILESQPVFWARLAISIVEFAYTLFLLCTTNIIDFMEDREEKKTGANASRVTTQASAFPLLRASR